MRINYLKIVTAGLLILSLFSCDTGLGLMSTKISGKVIFINSDKKPDFVESVWVFAAEKSIFDNLTLNDIIISDRPVDLSKDSSKYEIFVPFGTYIIVAAVWKEKGKDWNYQKILGFYGYDPVNFSYYDKNPVMVTKDKKVASGYNIICDWKFVFFGSSLMKPGRFGVVDEDYGF